MSSEEASADRAALLEKVKRDWRWLIAASEHHRNDREIVLAAVQENGHALQLASTDLKSNSEFMMAAVQRDGYALMYALGDLGSDGEIATAAVKQNGMALKFASCTQKNDRGIVLAAVQQNGMALRSAAKDLKNDREIATVAVNQDGRALEYVSCNLKNDREVVLAAVNQDSTALRYASADLRNDREINSRIEESLAIKAEDAARTNRAAVLERAKQNGFMALEGASYHHQSDREIVLAAVQQDGRALRFASDNLKNDPEVVLAAVRQEGWALECASADLKSSQGVVMAAVRQNGCVIQFASNDLKNDREVVMAAVLQDGMALEYASKELKNDRRVVLAAVRQDGAALYFASDDLKNDQGIVLAAVQQRGRALEHASVDLKNKRETVLAAVKQDVTALRYASDEIMRTTKRDREFMLEKVKQDGTVLRHALNDLNSDREIVLAAVKQNVRALVYVPTEFLFDNELTKVAAKLLCSEEGCVTLFQFIRNPGRAAQLGKFVHADPKVADCVNLKGVKAIGAAVKECREAMEKALRLFGDFDVEKGHLHFSRTACVLAATSHAEMAGETARVALKGMRDLDPVLAELRGRNKLDPNYVVAVRAIYVDTSIPGDDKKSIKKALPVYESESRTELAADVRYVEAEVEQSLRPLLASRIASASSSVGESSGRTSDTETNSSPGSGYRFMLVLELGGRALSTALMHDRIAGGDLHTARKIGSDVAKSVNHLHKKERTHSDIKPLNILRIGSTWQLTDLDVSCIIGGSFGKKLPSEGYCPPEMAILLLAARDEDAITSTEKISSYKADTAYDLWSLGVLLYNLVVGRSLWNCDENDNISTKDLRILADATEDDSEWIEHLDDVLFDLERCRSSPEEKAAADLLRKLLVPDPSARKKQFRGKFPMEAVLEEPFFQVKGVNDATLQDVAQCLQDVAQDAKSAARDAKSAATDAKSAATDAKTAAENTDKIIEALKEHRYEMITMRGVLLKGIFEATDVQTPSAFVVLEEPIPSEEEEKEMELLKLNDDGSGFELGGDAAKHAERAEKQLKLAEKWLELMKQSAEGLSDADPKKIFGSLKGMFEELVKAKTLYFYLVDELTGKPVRDKDGIYPIKITTPSDVVPRLLPVLQVCMHAMSFYNGVAGIARLFGAPVPSVPKSWREGAQESVETLKQKSSVEKFGVVHEEVMSDSPQNGKGGIRGESYRELQSFFKKYSKKDENDDTLYFAGLRRLGANDGTAVWTVLTDEQEVRDALRKREEERLAEEGAHEEYVNNLIRERAYHATPHEARKADNPEDSDVGAAQHARAAEHVKAALDARDDLETVEADTGNIYIIIEIVKGKGFKAMRKTLGKSDVPDVYCKVKYGSSNWKTHHIQDEYSPEWLVEKVCKYDPNQEIEIDVFDKNGNGSDDYYGRASSAVSKILTANNSSLELKVKEQESPHGLTNRWSDGIFITIKCRKLL